MDPNTAEVITTVVQVGGTILAVALGFVFGLLSERRRQKWEDRHRFSDVKRMVYVAYLRALRGIDEAAVETVWSDHDEGVNLMKARFGELRSTLAEARLIAAPDVLRESEIAFRAALYFADSARKGADDKGLGDTLQVFGTAVRATENAMRREFGLSDVPDEVSASGLDLDR
jgi:hypothetical protein